MIKSKKHQKMKWKTIIKASIVMFSKAHTSAETSGPSAKGDFLAFERVSHYLSQNMDEPTLYEGTSLNQACIWSPSFIRNGMTARKVNVTEAMMPNTTMLRNMLMELAAYSDEKMNCVT